MDPDQTVELKAVFDAIEEKRHHWAVDVIDKLVALVAEHGVAIKIADVHVAPSPGFRKPRTEAVEVPVPSRTGKRQPGAHPIQDMQSLTWS